MPTFLSGKTGALSIGATSHRLREWSISIASDPLDTSSLGSSADADGNVWRTVISGLNGATVSVSGLWDNDTKPTAATAFRPGLIVSLTLTIAAGVAISCSALVTSANPNVNIENATGFSAELTVNGAVTYPA